MTIEGAASILREIKQAGLYSKLKSTYLEMVSSEGFDPVELAKLAGIPVILWVITSVPVVHPQEQNYEFN